MFAVVRKEGECNHLWKGESAHACVSKQVHDRAHMLFCRCQNGVHTRPLFIRINRCPAHKPEKCLLRLPPLPFPLGLIPLLPSLIVLHLSIYMVTMCIRVYCHTHVDTCLCVFLSAFTSSLYAPTFLCTLCTYASTYAFMYPCMYLRI